MSTLPDPHFAPDERPLSDRERAVIDDIAGRENAGDPGFVTRLQHRAQPTADAAPAGGRAEATRRAVLGRARRRDLAIQAAVVVGLAAVVLPAAWFVAGVITLVLLVLPLALVAQAWRESGPARGADGGRGRGGSGTPDR